MSTILDSTKKYFGKKNKTVLAVRSDYFISRPPMLCPKSKMPVKKCCWTLAKRKMARTVSDKLNYSTNSIPKLAYKDSLSLPNTLSQSNVAVCFDLSNSQDNVLCKPILSS